MLNNHRPTPSIKRAFALGLAAASAVAVAACGSSTSDPDGPSAVTAASTTTAEMTADLAEHTDPSTTYPTIPPIDGGVADLKGKTVWYIPIGNAVPVLANFGYGIKDGLTAAGVKFRLCDGKFVPTGIASCMEQAKSQGADAVVTGYIDYALLPSAFDSLTAANIPVLLAGIAPSKGKTSTASLGFYDTTAGVELAQRLQLEKVITDSKGKAKIVYLTVTDSTVTRRAAEYGKKFVKTNCPDCTLVDVGYNQADLKKVPSLVASALSAHPDTTYVVDELDSAGQGTVAGIRNAGFEDKVKLTGANGDLDALQRIKSDTVQLATAGVGSVYQGWQFADAILRQMTGTTPVEQTAIVRIFDKSNIGSIPLTAEAYATNQWYGDDSFQDKFTSAWGLS